MGTDGRAAPEQTDSALLSRQGWTFHQFVWKSPLLSLEKEQAFTKGKQKRGVGIFIKAIHRPATWRRKHCQHSRASSPQFSLHVIACGMCSCCLDQAHCVIFVLFFLFTVSGRIGNTFSFFNLVCCQMAIYVSRSPN